MISGKNKAGRVIAAAAATAAAFTMVVPTGTSFAIDRVTCKDGENFLKIWSHYNGHNSVACYANKGAVDFGGWWIDKIYTGNNDMVYYDDNPTVPPQRINRWTTITYPNRPPQVSAIEIL
ncbi:beta/gamma crystallin domain-containing protein [Amycolatopsis sp. CA-230715]|uniref:beta/gamma crystallin domain-containing protein n=1 Tax=Amycolatopsis sp. CA-230715 TaxID=2745196 RepID=UPI001C02D5B4|nr:beta/gamma crystallin domain-containing protein [Amycolatopsis sp. CA-230715]QWF84735.1 hypothetical protein HUW46_08187 [Amycolatopsis sp. CA-230715]